MNAKSISRMEHVIGIVAIIVVALTVGALIYQHQHKTKKVTVATPMGVSIAEVKLGPFGKAVQSTTTQTSSENIPGVTPTTQKAPTSSQLSTNDPVKSSNNTVSSTPIQGSSGGATGSTGVIREAFLYDPIDNAGSPLSNSCFNNKGSVSCPSGGEGLFIKNGQATLVIPTGWSFNAGEYAYADTNNKPQDVHTSWTGVGSLPLTEQFQGQTVTLGFVEGSIVKN